MMLSETIFGQKCKEAVQLAGPVNGGAPRAENTQVQVNLWKQRARLSGQQVSWLEVRTDLSL